MKKIVNFIILSCIMALLGCSPVSIPVSNQYYLNSYSTHYHASSSSANTLLVTVPEAVAGYQTNSMLYVKKPYQLESFANNAWVDTPASMFYPLLIQSIQGAGYFAAVSSSPYTQGAEYRLDTQVLHLEQDFLTRPSALIFSIKIVLTRVSDSKVLVSRIFVQKMPCPADTPYGGVLAANKASYVLTEQVTRFIVSAIKHQEAIAKK